MRRSRPTVGLLAVAFAALCLYPHARRLGHPSLFSDDVLRIADLQMNSLGSILFRPFNEHMAPVFEVVSWATWRLAGGNLEAAAAAFTMASYVPFLLCLALLGLVVRRELGSTTTALVAVALFSLSSVYAEAVYWYSASSFTWALAGALAAFLAAGRAADADAGRRALPLGASALAALLAPACSAIGILAGPLGSLRLVLAADRPASWRARAVALAPMAGSLAYLALCPFFRHHDVVATSIERNIDLHVGLASIARAPIDVLIPGLFGLGNLDWLLGGGWDLALAGVALAVVLAAGVRSSRHRPLILGGLLLILGGYGLTYCVRTVHGPHWILEVRRYHLFPQMGLVLLLAPALRRGLRRFDARPARAWAAATALAVPLLLIQQPGIKHEAKFYRFPDQRATLAALDRLDGICRERGITREQALAALDPIRRRWFPHDFNALMMLADSVRQPRVPPEQVRPLLLAALAPAEEEALCGGLDATPHLHPAADLAGARTVAVGREVRTSGVRRLAPDGPYVATNLPAFVEYQIDDAGGSDSAPLPRALCLPSGVPADRPLEIWWTDDGDWSEARSIRWHPTPSSTPEAWAVPLDRLPHWEPAASRRIRVLIRSREPIALAEPRLLR